VRALLLENLGWKLLSLLVAVLLWAIVASEPELSTFATAPLQYRDLPDGLEVSSEPLTAVSLELRGPSGELRGLGDGVVHPSVILDMSGVQPGQRTFSIGGGNVKLARGVRLVRAIPSEVRFTFELTRRRTVPVVARLTGEGMHGYVAARHSVEPPALEIVGPESRVARIAAAVTDPVDISNASGESEFRVNAFVDDPFVRILSSPAVTVAVTMRKK
jgi:hypothetical protein